MDATREARTYTPAPGRLPLPARGESPAVGLRSARVLLACADPTLSDTLETVLRGHGEEVAPAGVVVRRVHDGIACLQALEMAKPDLLVLHSALDRMSGAEVLSAWRAAHPDERLPVLVLSSLYLSDLSPDLRREECIALPCDNLDLVERAARLLLEVA